jgi:hypothetical protein
MLLSLFRVFPVEVAASTLQAAGSLPAVCPDVAKLLAVVALREPRLRFVEFNFYCYVAEAGWFIDLLGFLRPGKDYKAQGKAC